MRLLGWRSYDGTRNRCNSVGAREKPRRLVFFMMLALVGRVESMRGGELSKIANKAVEQGSAELPQLVGTLTDALTAEQARRQAALWHCPRRREMPQTAVAAAQPMPPV